MKNTARRISASICLLVISSEGVNESYETRQPLDQTNTELQITNETSYDLKKKKSLSSLVCMGFSAINQCHQNTKTTAHFHLTAESIQILRK
jgi:hypothetical protein